MNSRMVQRETDSYERYKETKEFYVLKGPDDTQKERNVCGYQKDKRKCSYKCYLFIKRFIDIVLSFAASIVLLIPMALIAAIIMIKDFGNPFFVHNRVGMYGVNLPVLKFRSMKKGSEKLEHALPPELLIEYRKEYKISNDPRLIGFDRHSDSGKCLGGFIRKTSIDELPQIFWNICIKGNMTLVGPRPILREELQENYTAEEQELFLSVKPGLTGYWQAFARNNATYKTGERQRMELYYVQNQSLWLDVKILFATIGAVFGRKGAI